jgi:hypothetical protein
VTTIIGFKRQNPFLNQVPSAIDGECAMALGTSKPTHTSPNAIVNALTVT